MTTDLIVRVHVTTTTRTTRVLCSKNVDSVVRGLERKRTKKKHVHFVCVGLHNQPHYSYAALSAGLGLFTKDNGRSYSTRGEHGGARTAACSAFYARHLGNIALVVFLDDIL